MICYVISWHVQGTNYLAEDCNRLISFFDARSGRPGADNLFEDLFVSVSEQEDDPAQPTLFELLYQQMDKEPQKAESGGSSKSLDQDEKFSLLAPYVKLSADPQEVYLNMRVRGGVATEEEKQKLIQLQNQRTQKEKMLPDHAWLMEPCFPDVINEYIVDYKQQRTSQTRNNQVHLPIKTASISSKIRGNLSLNSVHQYTHQSIKPYHHLTLRSASGQGERPGGSPGSRMLRRSSTTR